MLLRISILILEQLFEFIIPSSNWDTIKWGEQKAQGYLILHLKFKNPERLTTESPGCQRCILWPNGLITTVVGCNHVFTYFSGGKVVLLAFHHADRLVLHLHCGVLFMHKHSHYPPSGLCRCPSNCMRTAKQTVQKREISQWSKYKLLNKTWHLKDLDHSCSTTLFLKH